MRKIALALVALFTLIPTPVFAQVGCQNYFNGATFLGCFKNWKADGVTITCTASGATVTCVSVGGGGGGIGLNGAYNSGVVAADNVITETAIKGPVVINGQPNGSVGFQYLDPSFGNNIAFEINTTAVRAADGTMTLGDPTHLWLNVYTNSLTTADIRSSAATMSILSGVADGAGAIGIIDNTGVTLTGAGAKIIDWQNNGVEKAYVDKDGNGSFNSIILPAQAANKIFAGPSSGAAAAPTFRLQASPDLPTGSATFSWVDATKRLGIGVAAPAYNIDLLQQTGVGAVKIKSSSTNDFTAIDMYDQGGTARAAWAYAGSTAGGGLQNKAYAWHNGVDLVVWEAARALADITVLSTGFVGIGSAATTPVQYLTVQGAATSAGTPSTAFSVTAAANTAQTAGTENTQVNFNLSATRQWSTGALTTQREVRFQAPAYSAVAASTFTTAATVDIAGPPTNGGNVTITNPYALLIDTGNIGFADGFGLRTTGGSSKVTLSDAQGTVVTYGANQFCKWGSSTTQCHSAVGDGASAIGFQVDTQNALATAGAAIIKTLSAANSGIYISMFTGPTTMPCAIAVDMLADTGGLTATKVAVWSANTGKAQDAAATVNLTMIAGVTIKGAANGAYGQVCIRGPALTACDAAVTAGQGVSTSAGTAGNVQSAVPPVLGAGVGRAMEATGTTIANKCMVDVVLF